MTHLTGKVVRHARGAGIGAFARLLDAAGVKLGLASRRGDDLGLEDVVAGSCA